MIHSGDCVLGPDGHCVDLLHRRLLLGLPPDLRRGSQEENRAIQAGETVPFQLVARTRTYLGPDEDVPALLDLGSCEIQAAGTLTLEQAAFIADTISAGLGRSSFAAEVNPPGSAVEPDPSTWQQPLLPALRSWQALYQEQNPGIATDQAASPAGTHILPRLSHDEILLALHEDRRAGDTAAVQLLTHEASGHDAVFGCRVPLWRCSYRDADGAPPCGSELRWGGGWFHVQAYRGMAHDPQPSSDADPDKPAPG